MMLRFEVKKVFSKSKNRMAIVLLFILLIVVCLLTMNRIRHMQKNRGFPISLR